MPAEGIFLLKKFLQCDTTIALHSTLTGGYHGILFKTRKKETIYGHFLICYLSLFLLRVLEIKCFKFALNSFDLINFMRDFKVVDIGDGSFINISQNQLINEKVKKITGLSNLDALFFSLHELNNLFSFCSFLDH